MKYRFVLSLVVLLIIMRSSSESVQSPFTVKKNTCNRSVLRENILTEFEALDELIPLIMHELARIVRQLDMHTDVACSHLSLDHDIVQMQRIIQTTALWIEQLHVYTREQSIEKNAPKKPEPYSVSSAVCATHISMRSHIADLVDALSELLQVNHRVITAYLAQDKTIFMYAAQPRELALFHEIMQHTHAWMRSLYQPLRIDVVSR